MRYALMLVPVLFLVGCGGGGEQRVVPDVRGQRLDRAERVLAEQKLDWREDGAPCSCWAASSSSGSASAGTRPVAQA